MEDQGRPILTSLETVRQQLLKLSDDIWRNIDHNDTAELERGVSLKRAVNERLEEFERVAAGITQLVQGYTNAELDHAPVLQPVSSSKDEETPALRDIDGYRPHYLNERFMHTRPYAFVLGDVAVPHLSSWAQFYVAVCKELAVRDRQRFESLPYKGRFHTATGLPNFTTYPQWRHELIVHGVYARLIHSANSFRDLMIKLLDEFGLPRDELMIYLRQDRDAEEGA